MKKITFALLILLLSQWGHAQILINEFQPDNKTTVVDPLTGKYSDWVELYNAGSASVDLGGYYLTDDHTDTTQWMIPAGTVIAGGGYVVVWADGRNKGLNANFKLGKSGDVLALYSPEKTRLDMINFYEIPADNSLGRNGDGNAVWVQFGSPTPATANNAPSVKARAPEVLFSHRGGYYTEQIKVSLSCAASGTKIFFTLDGSEPTTKSSQYSGPLAVSKITVLKAISVSPDYLNSRVSTRTYFVGERVSDMAVVSIGVDPYNFFDTNNGMYSLGPNAANDDVPYRNANFWQDRELPVTFEYYVGGKQKVEVNACIKIFGGWSRRFDQRSFSINCNKNYGDERMRYKLFPDKENEVYKQIVMRNSGSDVSSVRYRDMMIHSLLKGKMDIDHQDGVPAIVYINGKYWGIMNLREKVQERFIQDNYGIDDAEVDLIANYERTTQNGESTYHFDKLISYINSTSLSSATNYETMTKLMDVDEYMNYVIAQIFVANHDWPGYNIKYWREKGANRKWRWILYDTDQAFAYYEACMQDRNSLVDATATGAEASSWPNPESSTLILRKLLENQSFKNQFIQRFAAHLNSTFAPTRVTGIISDYEAAYSSEKPHHLQRWGQNDSAWNAEYVAMIAFAEERPDYMRQFIQDRFLLKGMSSLTIKTKNSAYPRYTVNSVALYGQDITGKYFNNVPFKVDAYSEGQRFLRWEDEAGTLLSTDASLPVTLTGAKTIVAVYREHSLFDNIYINEFMAVNTSGLTDEEGEHEDWIEIFNGNDVAVDLAGFHITDNLANPAGHKIPADASGKTIVPAKGYLVLWADGQPSQGPLHLDFKLSADGEQIGLSRMVDAEYIWIDSLSFGTAEANISAGRIADGGRYVGALAEATPGASNGKYVSWNETAGDESAVVVYPTDVWDVVYVSSASAEPLTVALFNLLGNKVLETTTDGAPVSAIGVSSIASGIYILRVQSGTEFQIFKLTIR